MLADGDHVRAAGGAGEQGFGARRLGFGGGDGAILGHALDHPVAADAGRFGVAQRVVIVGGFGQGGEEGHLADGQFIQCLVEIGLRGGGHAIGLGAHEDLVEIDLEDAFFAEGAFQAQGQKCLARFAQHRAVAADQHVLGHLLGDGGRALHAPA